MECYNKNKPVVLLKIETGDVSYPLGLLFLFNSLRKNGFCAKIIQLKSQDIEEKIDDALDCIKACDPLFVGISSMTGIQSHDAAIFSIKLKEILPDLLIVWGGIHPTLAPYDTIKQRYVDVVAMHEGERVVVDIANAVISGDDFSSVKGVLYKKNGEIFKTEKQGFIDLNDYVLEKEDFEAVDIEKNIEIDSVLGTRTIGIQTSRGCPYRCGFCYNEKFTNLKMRYLSPENLRKIIRLLRNSYNITDFMFVDDNIYFNKRRMFEIVDLVKNEGGKSTYLQMRIDDVSDESLEKLSAMGVKRLFFGIETGCPSTKNLVNKKVSNQLILDKIKEISKYSDLSVTCAFIIGLPTETEFSIDKTIDLAVEITKIHPNTLITLQAYVPFPGTDLLNISELMGYSMPSDPIAFKEYDSFDGDMQITWARYYGLQGVALSKKINLMNRYASLLTHNYSSTFARYVGKKILRVFAVFRLKNNFYRFPFEIYILHMFNRYYRELYKNKAHLSKRIFSLKN